MCSLPPLIIILSQNLHNVLCTLLMFFTSDKFFWNIIERTAHKIPYHMLRFSLWPQFLFLRTSGPLMTSNHAHREKVLEYFWNFSIKWKFMKLIFLLLLFGVSPIVCQDFEDGVFLAKITSIDEHDARKIGRRFGFEAQWKVSRSW